MTDEFLSLHGILRRRPNFHRSIFNVRNSESSVTSHCPAIVCAAPPGQTANGTHKINQKVSAISVIETLFRIKTPKRPDAPSISKPTLAASSDGLIWRENGMKSIAELKILNTKKAKAQKPVFSGNPSRGAGSAGEGDIGLNEYSPLSC